MFLTGAEQAGRGCSAGGTKSEGDPDHHINNNHRSYIDCYCHHHHHLEGRFQHLNNNCLAGQ